MGAPASVTAAGAVWLAAVLSVAAPPAGAQDPAAPPEVQAPGAAGGPTPGPPPVDSGSPGTEVGATPVAPPAPGSPGTGDGGAGPDEDGEGDARPRPGTVQRLTRPGVRAFHAFVDRRAVARTRPRAGARVVTRLRLRTEDGTDELVLVLARTSDEDGRVWLQVRLPVRPNNTTGWVPESALGPLHAVRTWLRIDTRAFRATLVRDGRVVFRARVGVGEVRWPTPRGEFYVRSRLTGYGAAGSFYGPLAFGTSAHSDQLTDWPAGGIVGIHGTSLPHLIPGRISHGCIRLRNADILRLDRLMPVGTPVTVR